MSKGFIVAQFYSQKDYLKVLEQGTWMVMGSYLIVSKWRSNFTTNDLISTTILVWVRVTNMPIEMLKDGLMTKMGNTIGRSIRVDTTSANVIQGNFARVCVEIDLNKPLFSNVMIMRRILKVEYDGLNCICIQC